jgi:hypothetical protein
MCDRVDSDPIDIFHFIDIVSWDEKIRISISDSGEYTRQESIDTLYHTIQSQFSEKKSFPDQFIIIACMVFA